jgi:ATP-dependent Lon protease
VAEPLSPPEDAAGRGAPSPPPLPPDALIIVAVRNVVLFPGLVVPLAIGRPKSVAAAQQAVREQRPIGVLLQRDPELSDPAPADLHRMGAVANIVRYITAPDGSQHLVCQGEQRFQVTEFLNGWPFFVARAVRIPEPVTRTPEIEARFLNLKAQAVEAIQLLPQALAELLTAVQAVESPAALADLAIAYMDVKPEEKQEILETLDITAFATITSRYRST